MHKIAISIGHNPSKPGEVSPGNVSEYSEMAVVAGFLVKLFQQAGQHAYMIGTGELEQKVRQINYIKPSVAIELHINAGGGIGFETLYCPGSPNGQCFASHVNDEISEVLGSRNRGIKEGWHKMEVGGNVDYFLLNTKCPAIIVEPYFMDNDLEREKYVHNHQFYFALAKQISVGTMIYLNGGC